MKLYERSLGLLVACLVSVVAFKLFFPLCGLEKFSPT